MADHMNLEHTRLYNLFGPAECTLTSVYHEVKRKDIERGEISIGRPFPNIQAFIFDEYRQPVIPGQVGELYLGGVQRSPGYLGRPDLDEQVSRDIFSPSRTDISFYACHILHLFAELYSDVKSK